MKKMIRIDKAFDNINHDKFKTSKYTTNIYSLILTSQLPNLKLYTTIKQSTLSFGN